MTGRFVGGRRVGAISSLIALSAAVLFSSSGSSLAASQPRKPSSPLQRGLQFYRGKTITLLASSAPGNPPYLWASLAAPILSSFLGADVVVSSESGAGGIPEQDNAAAAAPNGLTVGELSFSADLNNLLTHSPGLNFNPERVPFLGGNFGVEQAMISASTSPFTTIGRVLASKSTLPIMTTSTSGTNIVLHVLAGIYHLPVNYVAYPTAPSLLQGFIRGDEPLAYFSIASLYAPIESGLGRPLLLGTNNAHSLPAQLEAKLAGIPTIAQLLVKDPVKGTQARKAAAELKLFLEAPLTIFIAPTRTPSDEVLALRAAFKLALTNKAANATAFNSFGGGGYISGPDAKALYIDTASHLAPIAPYVPQL